MKEGHTLAKVGNLEIPEVNIDTLKTKLNFMLSEREKTYGKYADGVVSSSNELLETYWNAKNTTNDEEAQSFFTHLHLIRHMHKPEVLAVILEDMISNGNGRTEHYLTERDENIRQTSKIKNKAYEDDLVESGKLIRQTTVFSGNESPICHIFRLEDLDLIQNYVFRFTLTRYGLIDIDSDVYSGDIDGLYTKFERVTKDLKYGKLLSYIRCAQYVEAYILSEMYNNLSNAKDTLKKIQYSLDNEEHYFTSDELVDIVTRKIPITDVPKVSGYVEKITNAYDRVKQKYAKLKEKYAELKENANKQGIIGSIHSRINMAQAYRVYEMLTPEERAKIPSEFIDTLVYYGDFDSVKPFSSKKDMLDYKLSDKAMYLVMYMCTFNI
ncbi:MAG: hypothetical protein IKI57_00655 [Clostridia bacterium]|nr:hypothetical protein [Clostridia bacterium]